MALIDKARWEVLSPLLDQLLNVQAGERAALLDRIRRDDPLLAGELETLLAAMASAEREAFLEGSVLAGLEGESFLRSYLFSSERSLS